MVEWEESGNAFRLTPMQHAILLHSLSEPALGFYVGQVTARLGRDTDFEVFRHAWQGVVQRWAVLRTSFIWEGLDQPLQSANAAVNVAIPIYDWRDNTAENLQEQLETFLTEDRTRGFDLSVPPLMRWALFHLPNDERVFVWTYHHVLLDGRARLLVLKEVSYRYDALHKGRPLELAAGPEYREYVDWFYRRDRSASRDYWRLALGSLCTPILLSELFDAGRQTGNRRIGRQRMGVSLELDNALKALVQRHKVTVNMAVQAVWCLMLSLYTGEKGVIFGETRACRRPDFPGAASVIGLLINTVPIRLCVDAGRSFVDLLLDLRKQHVAMRPHEILPLSEIRVCSGLSAKAELFESIVVIEEYSLEFSLGREGADLWKDGIRRFSPSHYPLSLIGSSKPDLTLEITYDRSSFSDDVVQRMARLFEKLLETAVANPALRIEDLSALDEAERRQIRKWNATESDYPGDRTIAQLVEEQVRMRPTAVAVEFGERWLSYRDLNWQANQLARYLSTVGVRAEVPVGLCMQRSMEMVVSLLAIAKAGGVCVPLDPNYPVERLAYMMRDARADVLLARTEMRDLLVHHSGITVILDRDRDRIAQESVADLAVASAPENLGYLMYTSGSSGTPKGVGIELRSIVNLVRRNNYADLDSEQVFLQFTSISFDPSFVEIWGSLLNGGRLVVMKPGPVSLEELGEALERYKVTVLWLTASLFHQMVDHQLSALRKVRQLMAGGDVLSAVHVEKFLEDAPAASCLINGYGPTENTTFSCSHRMRRGWRASGSVPIGRPLANTQVHVLDENLCEMPISGMGDLYIGGASLARGYTDPALTADRFIPDAISGKAGARLYRSGDRGRWRTEGILDFLGRQDGQVKIRGYRIELGEIQDALEKCAGVEEAVVVVQQHGDEKRLVAFITGENAGNHDPKKIRRALQQKLPEYMVPGVFVPLERFPLSANGKVDRRALAALETISGEPESPLAAPRTPTEELLAGIWSDVLKREQVDTQTDFFDLGGHSLLVMQLRSRIRHVFRVELAFKELFQSPTVAGQAARIEAAMNAGKECEVLPILPATNEGAAPLSFAQQRLWFLWDLAPGSAHYNITIALYLSGPLETGVFQKAVTEIVGRHEVLRTTYRELEGKDGAVVQVIHPLQPWDVVTLDLRNLPETVRESALTQQLAAAARMPFDLAADFPLRTTLFRCGPESNCVVVTLHHIAADGWSIGIFLRELTALYGAFSAGQMSPLPATAVQYKDYAVWEKQRLVTETLAQQMEYWKSQLAGAAAVLELPTFRPRPAVQTHAGTKRFFSVSEDLLRSLRDLGRQQGTTLHMTLTAAFTALLYRYTGQQDILIGTPVAGRSRPEIEGLIGCFVNTLVLRSDLSDAPDFCRLLARMRQTALDAYAHQDLPFEKLVMELHPQRDPSREPLVQAMIVLQEKLVQEWKLGPVSARLETPENGGSKFDLTLSLMETGDGLQGALEYNTDLFEAEAIDRLAGHYRALLAAVVLNHRLPIEEIPLLDEAERRQIWEWNAPSAKFEETKCLHHLFEEQASLAPHNVAVEYEQRQLSYRELDERANCLGRYLRKLGVGPEVRVGICLEQDLETLIAILGILKGGGAYVPLDSRHPADRLQFMVEDSGIEILITRQSLLPSLPRRPARLVLLDAQWSEIIRESSAHIAVGGSPGNLAYVIYTSGSTGKPKGVMVSHHNVVRLLRATQEYYKFGVSDVWALFHSCAFDFSVWEIWGALAYGGKLIVVPHHVSRSPEEFYRLAKTAGITVLNQTSSAFNLFLQQDSEKREPLRLRWVIFGGEELVFRHLSPWFDRHEETRPKMVNMYGITETTVHVTLHEISKEDTLQNASLIGRVMSDLQAYVLNRAMQLSPVGVAGEIYVGGEGLARGYLDRPDLTAERFVPDPFSELAGARLYRTGDRARLTSTGLLEFLGRTDHQVKIRGYRIELREIEAVLESHQKVNQAMVLLQEDSEAEKRLLGFVTSKGDSPRPEPNELRMYLQKKLPDYMVPAAFAVLDALPLTANGKVDLQRLSMNKVEAPEEDCIAPSTPTEQSIAKIWAEILGASGVGADANFFDLGGHSLLAIKVASRIRALFKIDLSLGSLFEHPILSVLAGHVDSLTQSSPVGRFEPICLVDRGSVLAPSLNQEGRLFRESADRMQGMQSRPFQITFGLRFQNGVEVNIPALEEALNGIVRRHEVFRTSFENRESKNARALLSLLGRSLDREAMPGNVREPGASGSPYFRLVVHSHAAVTLSFADIEGFPHAQRQAELQKIIERESQMPFDYSRPPLMRVTLIQTGRAENLLAVTMHHLVSDQWSIEIFRKELVALYLSALGRMPANLNELPLQYLDFAAWQRLHLKGKRLEDAASYWKARWSEFSLLDVRELPYASPGYSQSGESDGRESVAIESKNCQQLRGFARKQGVTLYILLFAALSILLSLYTGRRRIGVWGHFANRVRLETEMLIGWFANYHLLGVELRSDPLIHQWIRTVRDVVLEADAHQEIPFPLLWMVALQGMPNVSKAHGQCPPHIAFDFKAEAFHSNPSDDLIVEQVALPGQKLQQALYLSASDKKDQILMSAFYSRAYFSSAAMRSFLDHWLNILMEMTAAPDSRISDLAGLQSFAFKESTDY